MPAITAISQHALDRFIERSGVKFPDLGVAMERLWDIAQKAVLHKRRDTSLVYASKGWRLVVTKKTVRTVYVGKKVRKRKMRVEIDQ